MDADRKSRRENRVEDELVGKIRIKDIAEYANIPFRKVVAMDKDYKNKKESEE